MGYPRSPRRQYQRFQSIQNDPFCQPLLCILLDSL